MGQALSHANKQLPGKYKLGESTPTDRYDYTSGQGLSEAVVREISARKHEPSWMRDIRLAALEEFKGREVPTWGADLSELKWDEITYYLKPTDKKYQSWDDVPSDIRNIFDKIGVPSAEKKYLAGVGSQYDSEIIYHSLQDSLRKQGVVFLGMDDGLREYPDIIKKYFGSVVPEGDNIIAALNTAVWSGGSFVYVPKGVKVRMPLQAYFRINSEKAGQFERTLIVAEEGSEVEYIEGCSAPSYSSGSLHGAVVEVIVKPGARVRYITVQNWFKNVYNLVTKRAVVEERARMEWVDCNIGSKVTMKYPSCVLKGKSAVGEMLSIAVAGEGQQQDAGAKMIHLAPDTKSTVISKSISRQGGRASYRGQVVISPKARGARSKVVCDALIMDSESRSDTYPNNRIMTSDCVLEHEAVVSKVGEEQLMYLRSRGFTEEEASGLIVKGFLEPVLRELPFEYAVELNRLVKLEMEGSVG